MKVLVVYAHPNPESFNAAILHQTEESLIEAGHDVHVLDLYKEGFEASMSLEERERYMTRDNTDGIEQDIGRLRWAEALVFIYPTWWMGPPAILKGWLDRIWLPGIVATFENGKVKPGLTKIKKILVITTQGAARWRMAAVGNPPRKMFRLSLKQVTNSVKADWMALYSMDKVTEEKRVGFLKKVQKRVMKL
ncbi:NAD(P)H-dependent oxidoreductase [Endozoicomonas sp. OPT23]|uniref:NAD(P)H-dependent oxidoreductase n=1 Tax=Endozoicomonas sp. OPT23 TaxID=2072845 RepID=UPI0018915D92|nr:NAD(P)H-dependent oxidoreductase [Endozoicomonas sp. OPT23]